MISKRTFIKGLLILNAGLIIGKAIGSIPTPKADSYILSLFQVDSLLQVPNWLIYLTFSCAVVGTYLTNKKKLDKKGGN